MSVTLNKETIGGVVDGLWVKGIARFAMMVALPVVLYFGQRGYEAFDRLATRQEKSETALLLLGQTVTTNAGSTQELVKQTNERVQAISSRMGTFPTANETIKDFALRDLRMDNIDKRITMDEQRWFPKDRKD